MKATELRIGNLVNLKDKGVYEISSGHDIDELIDWDNTDYCTGIELTEEWLEKFEFTQKLWRFGDKKIKTDLWQKQWLGISKVGGNNPDWQIIYNENIALVVLIQYVHELQNLYFSLTGKELLLKQRNQSSTHQSSDNEHPPT